MLIPIQSNIGLGRVKKNSDRRFRFTLRNEGSSTVKIDNIKVGCGSCTTAHTIKTVLQPNETSDIEVKFSPKSAGVQEKSVYVFYNGNNQIKLTFTADVYE